MERDPVLDEVGPRLRALRQRRGSTLAEVSEVTGISVSTLSRLEGGGRKPTLELLLALARAYQVPLDEVVGAPPGDPRDPRVRARPVRRNGRTLIPLTRRPGGIRAYKMIAPPGEPVGELRSHEGYEWMYVLSGRLRLRLGEHDVVMKPGEAAEFDTRTPHWFGSAGPEPAELLVLFGPQGERIHVRARPRHRGSLLSRRRPGRQGHVRTRENRAMVRGWPVRLAGALTASAVVVTACGGGAGVPGPPSAYLGAVLDRPVPDSVADLPLTTDAGQPATLAAFHGQVVVLADFLTLCQETCPLTAGNLLVMDRAVIASGLAGRVRFVELTVDPGRDTPARLRAYRALVGARANWSLLTGRPDVIERIWGYFGVWYQRVAEGSPPGVDWLTGKPLRYDVTHQDALIYLDASGRERFLVVGSPNANGASVAPALRRFLSAQGRADLGHPDASTWTAAEALSPITWLTGRQVGLPAG